MSEWTYLIGAYVFLFLAVVSVCALNQKSALLEMGGAVLWWWLYWAERRKAVKKGEK